jgi:hypothetical protein
MRFPGYRPPRPDPPMRGVMAPPRPARRSALPRIRFSVRCLLGRHRPDHYRLWATGEKWSTFVYICLRCNRVVGDSHAIKDYEPRDVRNV